MTDKTSKRFFWNSNAATHLDAVFSLFVLSVGVSAIENLLVGVVVFHLLEVSRLDAVWVVVAMGASFAIGWLVMFVISILAYYRLIESQVINPPTDKVIHEKRTFYQTGDNQFKQHK